MKKVLIITYYWPPAGGAGVQRTLKFAKYFPQSGIEPVVITVDEKHASYPVIDKSLFSDISNDIKVYRTKSFEPLRILTGITGNPVPHSGFSNKDKQQFSQKVLRLIRGNLFLPDARRGWVKFAFKKACELIAKENIITVIISSPPHSSQLIGLKLKKKFPRLNWVADMRDPWTDIYYYNDMLPSAIAKQYDKNLEIKVLETADKVVVVSSPIKNGLLNKSDKLNENKFFVIPNGFDEDDFKIKVSSSLHEFRIVYTGTMAESYEPKTFFKAFKYIIDRHIGINFKIYLVGGCSPGIVNTIHSMNLQNHVAFIEYVEHAKAIEYMLSCTMLLLLIPKVADNKGILTGKLFEYLAARKPILCLGPPDGEAAAIINECGGGKTIEHNNEHDIELYIEELISQWKLNHDLSVLNNNYLKYSRKNLTKQLAGIVN